jgi:large subunit ribosomal protein L24
MATKTARPSKAAKSLKVKKGDTVLVIAGKDKGAKGKVISADPDKQRVMIEGVNRVTKHTKVQQSQRGSKSGGIITTEAPIHVSNVQIVHDGKPTRIGYRFDEVTDDDGNVKTKKVRVARSNGEDL